MSEDRFESQEHGNIRHGDGHAEQDNLHIPYMRDTHPTGEFDNTSLEDFGTENLTAPADLRTLPENMPSVSETVAPPAEHQFPRPDNIRSKTSTRRRLYATITGGVLLLGAGLGIGHAMSTEQNREMTEEAEDSEPNPDLDEAKEESAATVTTPDSEENSTNNPAEIDSPAERTLDITKIIKGEETISMQWNGQTIEIPRLRDTNDTKLFLESFFALEACYISTGNTECLNELTDNMNYRGDLVAIRNLRKGVSSNEHLDNNGAPDSWQVAIYDNPDDPAVFSDTVDETGARHIELTSGTLYQNYWHATEWQGEDTKQMIDALNYNFVTSEFRITVKKDPSNNDLKVTDIYWQAD